MVQDFRYQVDSYVCGVRAAALIIQDKQIYLYRDRQNRYYLVGGALAIGETSIEAVKREVMEEIGIDVEVERLAFVVENSFCQGGVNFHNVEFHYQVRPLSQPAPFLIEGDERIVCEWVPLTDLDQIDLVPAFLRKELGSLTEGVTHIMNMEDRED